MGTRIVHFGTAPASGILAALAANGYEVDACGTSVSKLKQVLTRRDDFDAVAVTENDAPKALDVLTPVRSTIKVPLILFRDDSSTSDPSQFDLVVPKHLPLPDLLERVAALIERSRVVLAESESLCEQQESLRGEVVALREQVSGARFELQRQKAKRRHSETERASISSVLVVDDYARWRETMCSMLSDYADCQLLWEAEDGIEAVLKAIKFKPRLILLDLDLPRQNGIQAARKMMQTTPDSAILFVSINKDADIVREALSTGAKGYLLKADAPTDFWPAIEAVLQNKQYLSRSLRGLHSVKVN